MPTILDLNLIEGGINHDLISEVAGVYPELGTIDADPIDGTSLELTVRTDLPNVSFSLPGQGVGTSGSKYVTRTFQTANLAQLMSIARTVLENKSAAVQARYMSAEQQGFIEAATRLACRQFYYGTSNDPKGFIGLIAQMGNTPNHIIDVAGSLGARSSVFFVADGPNKLQWILGNNRSMAFEDWKTETIPDPTDAAKMLQALIAWMYFNPGLRLANKNAVVRIKGITEEAGKKITHDILQAAANHAREDLGIVPTKILMSFRTREQYRQSFKTPEHPNPPTPKDFDGIPIIASNSISNNETI